MKNLLKSKPAVITLLILVLLLLLYIALKIGFYMAQSIFVQAYEEQIAFDKFVQYETSRDIATYLKSGNYKLAKCRVDLEASSKFDAVKKCMGNKSCAIYIANDVNERTPELINSTPLSFNYIQSKDHVRRCD